MMNAQRLTFEDIYRFFQTPQPTFLNQELTVCYLMSVLVISESYGTELVQKLRKDYPNYRLSDTILQNSLRFLEKQGIVTSYWKKPEKRGRPRRMYQLCPEARSKAEEFGRFWQDYTANDFVDSLITEPSPIA